MHLTPEISRAAPTRADPIAVDRAATGRRETKGRSRRRVDWSLTVGDPARPPRLQSPSGQVAGLAEITSALLSDPSPEAVDRVLRQAVDFARTAIGLERVSIFLLDASTQTMVGTWGTGADGELTDEHDIMYGLDDLGREVFARAARGHAWSIYEDCPLTAQRQGQTLALGRGWVACTPIPGGDHPVGVLYNDTALTRAPLDEGKQARAAVLCALLGRALQSCRQRSLAGESGEPGRQHPLVREATQLLVRDPALGFAELARRLGVSRAHLTRTFRRHAKTSIVNCRNELRLAWFLSHANGKAEGLLESALAAGFGSYAQFHRVFRARFGQGPREYLFDHRDDLTGG
jgi:AraC-like DNA-binding protein